ncbi:DHA2 family efflux MFS transporter permease subunit [Nonomuraea sp. NPDC050227]|uniref:DHA2 family efflux MFS transporter permease subunit n=1 Tax=Nonomuraea sp. NPDC050227 TaxID=3364360 RepID=UPI003798EB2F
MTGTTAARPGLDRRLLTVAGVLTLGAFTALLDGTVVGVATHTLARAFSADLAATQWVTTAYLLALAAVIPATGWAAQRFGAGTAWTASLAVFLAGSILCGSAWSLGSLIAFRVVQGAGAGMLFPLSRIIVVEVAGRERLGRMMALMAVPAVFAPVLGPVVGGVLLETLSWRWVFLVNVPFVAAGVVLSALYVRTARPEGPAERLDVAGLLGVSGGLTLLLHGLSGAGELVAALTAAAGALLLAACLWRAARTSGPRIVEPGLFRDRAFAASAALAFLANFSLFAAVFLVPLFVQTAEGSGALGAGLVLAPQGLGMLVAVLAAGRLIDLNGNPRRIVVTGLVLLAAGTLPFALADPGTGTALLPVALFVRGVGAALAVAPTMITLYHSLPPAKVPAATTANAIGQQVGAAAGTACVAVLLQHGGYRPAFWVTLAAVALCLLPALFLPSSKAGTS